MPPALLDVNVLVALFVADHIHHQAAHAWFAASSGSGWATCPLTENGVVRILSNLDYSGVRETADSIRRRLNAFCRSSDHLFWPDSLSLRDERFRLASVSHRQLTDVYLLGLAVEHGGRLATFDQGIPRSAVAGAEEIALAVIPS